MAKWLITGASSGLGLALTKKVLSERHSVVAAVRRVEVLAELTEQDIQQQIALNLLALIHITRAFLPAFRAKNTGTFIHITSIGGRVSFAIGALYHAAEQARDTALDIWKDVTLAANFGAETVKFPN